MAKGSRLRARSEAGAGNRRGVSSEPDESLERLLGTRGMRGSRLNHLGSEQPLHLSTLEVAPMHSEVYSFDTLHVVISPMGPCTKG